MLIVIVLKNGTEIIGEREENQPDDSFTLLRDVFRINLLSSPNGAPVINLTRYVIAIESPVIAIPLTDILTVGLPHVAVRDHYKTACKQFESTTLKVLQGQWSENDILAEYLRRVPITSGVPQ